MRGSSFESHPGPEVIKHEKDFVTSGPKMVRMRIQTIYFSPGMNANCPKIVIKMPTYLYIHEFGFLLKIQEVFHTSEKDDFQLSVCSDQNAHCFSILSGTYLDVFEKLEVLALGYIYHTQQDRTRLEMDTDQTMACLKKR